MSAGVLAAARQEEYAASPGPAKGIGLDCDHLMFLGLPTAPNRLAT